jgi:hypothetical protein
MKLSVKKAGSIQAAGFLRYASVRRVETYGRLAVIGYDSPSSDLADPVLLTTEAEKF